MISHEIHNLYIDILLSYGARVDKQQTLKDDTLCITLSFPSLDPGYRVYANYELRSCKSNKPSRRYLGDPLLMQQSLRNLYIEMLKYQSRVMSYNYNNKGLALDLWVDRENCDNYINLFIGG